MKLVVLHLLLRPTNEGLRYDTFVKRDLCNQNRPKRNLQTIYLLLLLRPTNEGPRYDRESVSLFYRSLSIYRSLLTHSRCLRYDIFVKRDLQQSDEDYKRDQNI